MSWMKRAQSGAGPGPGPQSYAAPQAQAYTNQQNMYPNYPGGTGSTPQQPQQQYWQAQPAAPAASVPQPPQQYNQQYAQTYQQNYPANANQMYQQTPQYNHNYTNPGYTNPPHNYQPNYYQNQPTQQNYPQNPNNDGWEDNWDWGWEESAKQAQKAQNAAQHAQQVQAPNNANNANVIEESFISSNSTWNWAMEEKKGHEPSVPPNQESNVPATLPMNPLESNKLPEPNIINNGPPVPTEEVRSLNDRDVVKERMPNLALGKRIHLENLTPQWSIESQMSQESSDGPQTHSESTYRSENQSRNSNSPGPVIDNSNFNNSQSGLEEGYTQNSEWSRHSDELTLADSTQSGSRRESHDEPSYALSYTMQELTIANHENPSSDTHLNQIVEPRNSQSVAGGQLETAGPGAGLPPPPHSMPSPRPPSSTTSSPAPTPTQPSAPTPVPPRPPSATLPTLASNQSSEPPAPSPQPPPAHPPPNFPPPSNSQNPFKHSGPFGHKHSPSSSSGGQPYLPPAGGGGLTAPGVVGKVAQQQSRTPLFEANLETTPDNSERPDQPPPAAARPAPPPPAPVPDNLEVAPAPRGDRDQYLQTAHLSGPPPGLRRMVPGRPEPEPARLVPGRRAPDDYLERLVDGRPPDGGGRPYRPPDEYGFGRMVPGEAGGAYPPYAAAERRVVTGLEREHDLDGSEYAQLAPPAPPPPDPRDGTMEGENLQDLGAAAAELAYAREQDAVPERRASASPERPAAGSRRGSPARRSSDDTDRERRDRRAPRDERYPRADRYEREGKSARDERRADRERRDRRDRPRRDRSESPDARRARRSARPHRYETEDTDYYSDRERERRRHREGSHAGKPPRDERDGRARRERRERHERSYRDIDPARKYGNRRRERDEEERRRVTFSREAKASNSRSEGEPYSGGSRAESREAAATDEDAGARRGERGERARRSVRRAAPRDYYDGFGAAYADPYAAQRQQYEYYERLRLADPAAYMQLYKRLMAARADAKPHDMEALAYGAGGLYEARDERGSVHSGRSSAGLKGNDTFALFRRAASPRAPASPRTDGSDRDLTTEVSLPTNLETSTVRSERMTPHRFSTAHAKASIASRHIVVVRGAYPVDGRPATVQLLALPAALAHDAAAAELAHSPGPLLKGVTHKKSVMEYCAVRVRSARREAPRDVIGYVLLWQLLTLLLRQNGVVVGSDIAELLMKNAREYEYKPTKTKSVSNGSRRASSASVCAEEPPAAPEPERAASPPGPPGSECGAACADEREALDKLREYLIYGNRQEALEWAMSNNLWGHALQLAAYSDRRTRGAVAARFLAATPRRDPLHTLYAALAAATPPAATCVSEERWGDWRPHAAILLANSARPDHTTRTLTMLGDSLASRGLAYCAQFCYVSGGVPFSRHPRAPLPPAPAAAGAPAPRLWLLLGEPRAAALGQLASSRAVLATEIYEYAMSLNQDYVIPELQVYKFVLATRLVDCGQYERALAYVEQAARAVTAAPRLYSPRLVAALADMADRLKYHDPALHDDPPLADEDEGSPRHQQWLHDVAGLAHKLQAEASQQATPLHQPADYYGQQQQQQQQPQQPQPQQQYSWDQAQQYQQPLPTPPVQPYAEAEEPAPQYAPPAPEPAPAPAPADGAPYHYEDWNRTEEHHAQSYADSSYWQGDAAYGYGEGGGAGAGAGAGAEGARPMITMPASQPFADYEDDRPPSAQHEERPDAARKPDKGKEEKGDGKKGSGWLGGILNKLSLRAPNQMILPDDKNPTIVWDAATKRWKNLDGEEADGEPPPPPPSAAELARLHPTAGPPPAAGAPPVANIFKMQKGRHIKKSYVDVFNPSGAAPRPLPDAAAVLGPAPPPASAHPAYFVPAPDHPASVSVSVPSSPASSPSPPIPDVTPAESGVYSPAQAQGERRDAGI